MKKNKQNKKFLELFMTEVPAKKLYHGDDPLLDKLVNPKNGETVKKLDYKKAGALLLAPVVLAGGIAISAPKNHTESNLPTIIDESNPETKPAPLNKNKIYIDKYKNNLYYFATEEYVLSLASESLNRVQMMLSQVDGITPVGTTNGEFYPDYFNPYLLAALCHTESSYRIMDINGKPLTSSAGAIGMTQIKPEVIDDLNNWLHNTLKLKNITYSIEDLNDPAKTMDITTLILIQLCKNHGKIGCNNPIYTHLHEGFNLKRQEEIILALYNNGFTNMQTYIKNGTLYNYLREGSPSNYVNKILQKKEQLIERYGEQNLIS